MKQTPDILLAMPAKRSVISETLFLTLYTLFVLLLFQPFGTHEYRHTYKMLQLAGYGIMVLALYPFVRTMLLRFSNPSHTLRREALLLMLCFCTLSLGGFFYHALVINNAVNWHRLIPFMVNCLIVFILPFSAMMYHAYVRSKRVDVISPPEKTKVEIRGTNQYESFYFNAADVLYLRSNGNYVMVYFQKEGALKHEMVRNTFAQVSAQLPGGDFIPIHRSFLANLKHFDRLQREEGKYLLVSQRFDLRLPVSRNQVPLVEQKLRDHS